MYSCTFLQCYAVQQFTLQPEIIQDNEDNI
jgi:hypothetical protein